MPAIIRGWNNTGAATPKSGQVAYAAGDTLADIIQKVEDFITARGWALYDAAAGVNARAYRHACIPDAEGQIAYQPIVLDYNTAGYLLLKQYESWNPATHVGVNLTQNSGGLTFSQRIDLTFGGEINIACNQGLLLLYTRANSNWGNSGDQGPTWVCEMTRIHALDTVAAGFPRWCWGCTERLHGSNYPLQTPRTRAGVGGVIYMGVISDYGVQGYFGGNYISSGLMPAFNSALTGKPNVSNIRAVGQNTTSGNTENLGTAIGLLVMTRTQNANIGGEGQVTVNPVLDHPGLKVVDHDGAVEMWWIVGAIIGTQGRLLVEK